MPINAELFRFISVCYLYPSVCAVHKNNINLLHLYIASLGTQKCFTWAGGDLLIHHQCAASTDDGVVFRISEEKSFDRHMLMFCVLLIY